MPMRRGSGSRRMSRPASARDFEGRRMGYGLDVHRLAQGVPPVGLLR